MDLLNLDITRLIHHHLIKEGYEKTANQFISECPHFKGFQPGHTPHKLPRLPGPSLADLLESYLEASDFVIEELYLLKTAEFKEHDSLLSLTKTLVTSVKSQSAIASTTVREICDVSVSTKVPELRDVLHHSSLERRLPLSKETCDASVDTYCSFDKREDAPNSYLQPMLFEREGEASVSPNLVPESPKQEKIAEQIYNKKASPDQDQPSQNGNLDTQHKVIKAVVAETHADPVLLKDCTGNIAAFQN